MTQTVDQLAEIKERASRRRQGPDDFRWLIAEVEQLQTDLAAAGEDASRVEAQAIAAAHKELIEEVERLLAQRDRLLAGLKRADAAMERHDKAPYQCESCEGAEAAMEARDEIRAAIAAAIRAKAKT